MGGGHHCFSTATVAMILMCLSRDRAQTHQKQTCSPPDNVGESLWKLCHVH